MTSTSKSLTSILIGIVAISCVCMLVVKPANAQNNTIPSVSIVYPTNGTFFNVSVEGVYFQLLYQTNDKISWAGFSINGGANVTCTGNVTDYNAYVKAGYLFNYGRLWQNTLILYANDTAGNWAIPQTVTFTVNFYPDTTYPPSTAPTSASPAPTSTINQTATPLTPAYSQTQTATPSPTIPELPSLVVLPLLLSLFSVAVIVRQRKKR
jgi:hypothetical protein